MHLHCGQHAEAFGSQMETEGSGEAESALLFPSQKSGPGTRQEMLESPPSWYLILGACRFRFPHANIRGGRVATLFFSHTTTRQGKTEYRCSFSEGTPEQPYSIPARIVHQHEDLT
jgi:hypothetical protein